jgi:hypothetical protein
LRSELDEIVARIVRLGSVIVIPPSDKRDAGDAPVRGGVLMLGAFLFTCNAPLCFAAVVVIEVLDRRFVVLVGFGVLDGFKVSAFGVELSDRILA